MLRYVSVADIVLWSPEAKVYVVVADRSLDIYSVEVGHCGAFILCVYFDSINTNFPSHSPFTVTEVSLYR